MDELIQAGELADETRRLLRYRIPLFLAVLVNFTLLVRMPITRMWAEAAPPLGTKTPVLAVAGPTTRPQTPPQYSPVHAVSQGIETRPAESATPSPSATPAGVSPFAFTNSWGRAAQRLIADWSAPLRQTAPAANSGPVTEPVSMPFTMAAAEPPVVSSAGVSPLSHPVDSPSTGLTIRNALENEESVSFLVNGRVCELQPGEAHAFAVGTSWTVRFHRGGSYGDAQQTLVPGVYHFVVTGQGWDLEANR